MIALLVLRPGPLRDGLNALLSAMPEIGLVAQSEDADAADTGGDGFWYGYKLK